MWLNSAALIKVALSVFRSHQGKPFTCTQTISPISNCLACCVFGEMASLVAPDRSVVVWSMARMMQVKVFLPLLLQAFTLHQVRNFTVSLSDTRCVCGTEAATFRHFARQALQKRSKRGEKNLQTLDVRDESGWSARLFQCIWSGSHAASWPQLWSCNVQDPRQLYALDSIHAICSMVFCFLLHSRWRMHYIDSRSTVVTLTELKFSNYQY